MSVRTQREPPAVVAGGSAVSVGGAAGVPGPAVCQPLYGFASMIFTEAFLPLGSS